MRPIINANSASAICRHSREPPNRAHSPLPITKSCLPDPLVAGYVVLVPGDAALVERHHLWRRHAGNGQRENLSFFSGRCATGGLWVTPSSACTASRIREKECVRTAPMLPFSICSSTMSATLSTGHATSGLSGRSLCACMRWDRVYQHWYAHI